ncbi:MAG TPA: hypothetical protein VGT40_10440 [Methylomirabilota bacterium]|jgi:hypothetical protein|nr:hypothetical protein [Methylomirabilota bacterium]
MALREPYKGYVLQADPVRCADRWRARVTIELHEGASVHRQLVSDDPFKTYPTRHEAEQVSLSFGRALLDSRPSA